MTNPNSPYNAFATLLSNSGQSEESLRLIPVLKRFGARLGAFTSNPASDLARNADLRLLFRVPAEACPLRLAPTASTTAAPKPTMPCRLYAKYAPSM